LTVAGWFVALTVGGLIVTLVSEDRYPLLRAFSKLLASAGFLGVAVSRGAVEHTYGRWVFAALIFGWIGDAALLGSRRVWFLVGLTTFLIGHLIYVVAFLVAGIAPVATMAAAVVAAPAAVVVFRWLRPQLPPAMVAPVAAYAIVISAMVVFATGATAAGSSILIVIGAAAFFVSDLAVARNRFVAPGIGNRLWGLPLYYTAQILLAWSVA
jgi:uncharacterized membrane protein YhhN